MALLTEGVTNCFLRGGPSLVTRKGDMDLIKRVKSLLLAGQHGHPKGIIGHMLGKQMVRQHIPETDWTISLLNIQSEDQVLELGFGAGRAIELVACSGTKWTGIRYRYLASDGA